MKPRSLFDVNAWVSRTFTPPPKPAMPVVDMVRTSAPKSTGKETQEEKVVEKHDPFPTVDPRGCSPAVRQVIQRVSQVSGVSMTAILGRRRLGEHVVARQIAAWMSRNFTDRSLPAIASELGDRNHTTILFAIRKIDAAISARGIEPEEHTIEGWTRALLSDQRKQARLRAKAWADRQRARQAEKYARHKARRQATK